MVDDHLTGVRLRDGSVVPRQALVVTPRFVSRSQVLTALGLQPTAHPFGGEFVAADAVVVAAAGGASAAAAINADLVAEDTRLAVSAHRNLLSDAPERVCASVS